MVENIIGENRGPDIQYTVFCSSKDFDRYPAVYKEAKLTYIPLHANGIQSTVYDSLSLIRAIRGYDVILVLGVSGGLFFPVFRLFCRKKLVVNIDGMEYKRAKWGRFAKLFLRVSEEFALRFSDVVVADNQGIVDYIKKRYKKKTVLIAYGGDHVRRDITAAEQERVLSQWELTSGGYSLAICRIEPENNCHVTLEAFVRTNRNLVFVGNWQRSEYGRRLKERYARYANILLLESIYDLDLLFVLRTNCRFYVHSHSAGGTNPSLVEAMFFGRPVLAFDVVYNRVTTENKADYFEDITDLALLLVKDTASYQANALAMKEIAGRQYTWRKIAEQYERCFR